MDTSINQAIISQANTKFLHALLTNDLTNIVTVAYEIFNSPIIVVDSNSSSICQIPNQKLGIEFWDNYLLKRDLTINAFEIAEYQFTLKRNEQNNISYLSEDNLLTTPHLSGEFYNGPFLAGHFTILCLNKKINPTDFELAQLFGKILTHFFTTQQNFSSNELFNHLFLTKLLTNEKINYLNLDQSLTARLQGTYLLFVCPILDQQNTATINDYIYNYLQTHFKTVFTSFYENNLVLLYCGLPHVIEGSFTEYPPLKQVIDFLQNYNFIISISNTFTDLNQVKDFYQQTLLTFKIGKLLDPNHKIYKYQTYEPLQLFYPICEKINPEIWYSPLFKQVKDWDAMHHTPYLTTLIHYFTCAKNKNDTAKSLHIHINTLNYRLNKINDLFDCIDMTPSAVQQFCMNYYLYLLRECYHGD